MPRLILRYDADLAARFENCEFDLILSFQTLFDAGGLENVFDADPGKPQRALNPTALCAR
ncbi:MAG: hypothetical protein EOP23_00725 [Hyphomicrobiales bacterium]|nr:MAG: hypothetical protein EOP23_00725 [Hyphomicrobiales bacterium]